MVRKRRRIQARLHLHIKNLNRILPSAFSYLISTSLHLNEYAFANLYFIFTGTFKIKLSWILKRIWRPKPSPIPLVFVESWSKSIYRQPPRPKVGNKSPCVAPLPDFLPHPSSSSNLAIEKWATYWWKAAGLWRNSSRIPVEFSSYWSYPPSREFCYPNSEFPFGCWWTTKSCSFGLSEYRRLQRRCHNMLSSSVQVLGLQRWWGDWWPKINAFFNSFQKVHQTKFFCIGLTIGSGGCKRGFNRCGISANFIRSAWKICLKNGSQLTYSRSCVSCNLCVLMYCHSAEMITGRVCVWTPKRRAKRWSNLNWSGW